MRTIMARSPHESSFSFSKRHFLWKKTSHFLDDNDDYHQQDEHQQSAADHHHNPMNVLNTAVSSDNNSSSKLKSRNKHRIRTAALAMSRLRTVLTSAISATVYHHHHHRSSNNNNKVIGTLFGRHRGHVCFAFQSDPRSPPVAVIELAAPTSALVKEMASGLVRIALECQRNRTNADNLKLLEEKVWRAYCNGKKCGYAARRECGPEELRVLKAVEPVTMGAGVLPPPPLTAENSKGLIGGKEGEMMYMRARFERVVGSKDSEAFYMINPDGNGGPELSIYFLRV